MSGKTNKGVTQEGRERYGDEALAGATSISQNSDKFIEAEADFDTAIAENSAARARSQRAGNLTNHATGTVAEIEEDKTEEDEARNRYQPERNRVEEATGEVYIIFEGGNNWGNNSAPLSAPHTLGIPGGDGVTMTQHDTAFPEEGHAPTLGTA